MISFDNHLGVRFPRLALGLSARRAWEHTQLRQKTPFEPITPNSALKPRKYIDIVEFSGPVKIVTGLTLADLVIGETGDLSPQDVKQLLWQVKRKSVLGWVHWVEEALVNFSEQLAVRNAPAGFLPLDRSSPFEIEGLHCALITWLNDHRSDKDSRQQWSRRIGNLRKNGLRAEELAISRIEESLVERADDSITGDMVTKCLAYDNLQLSILPMVQKVGRHLLFTKVPADSTIKRIKPKLKRGLLSRPQWRDSVLGYWVDVLNWNDLFGHQRGWMAFTHRGRPITSSSEPLGLCKSKESACGLADAHAKHLIPKLTTKGLWTKYRLTGGEQYREWLVTLPNYGPSFFSDHFDHRNILLHIRCDIREGADGERVLVLQEVQSDWAQQARRQLKAEDESSVKIPIPPWLHEWPALALKLILLHAAHLNVRALAWTPGWMQVRRYNGLGENGLIKLYDRTLPRELSRILRPYNKKCEEVDIVLPVNFRIDRTETGYVVMDEENNLFGWTKTCEEAQKLLTDCTREGLTTMHGIKLDGPLRRAIRSNGFHAWGSGIR